ncbi:hypothetical protein FB45DRAFT_906298 [Roridomyces roridus]|uniref:Uncharacterized protein n=1 Tax=Roridomyces roridus TaxID=1738132 RepID=A0AAD7FPR8_9AGAR|nr:hypothetical protein FB45DRAFT_906298 [Roridomyces roridus]
MLLLAHFLLLLPSVRLVGAFLQNLTVDDTSEDIIYSGPVFQCNTTSSCGIEPALQGLYNHSATFTNDSITFRFQGVAYYADIAIFGSATIELDGVRNPGAPLGVPGTVDYPISQTGLTNDTHTLSIHPTPGQIVLIGFDSLIYTAIFPDTVSSLPDAATPKKKSHAGAIAGGVIGGLAVVFGILLAGLFAHRRKLILWRNQRKGIVLRRMDAASRRNQSEVEPGEEDAKVVPAM